MYINELILMNKAITVSELNDTIKKNVKNNVVYKVLGTANNINFSGFRNIYFSIGDVESSINAILWNYDETKSALSNNIEYEFEGRLEYYTKMGRVNFIVTKFSVIKQKESEFDILKAKLTSRGLIKIQAHEVKKPVNILGIITSLNGAAMNDILVVLRKNNFKGFVIVKNSLVQGLNASRSIIDSIEWFNKHLYVDALIITRGGGSESDLNCYSDEELCNAVHKCNFLTISAVGHQRDNVMLDYVCDIRASTPTMAGELVSKQSADFEKNVSIIENRLALLKGNIRKNISVYRKINNKYKSNIKDPKDDIKLIEDKMQIIKHNIIKNISIYKSKLKKYDKPKIMTYLKCDGKIVTSLKEFNKCKSGGKEIKVYFKDGHVVI